MSENVNIINQGFRHLLKALAPYVVRELQIEYKDEWWREGVLNTLRDDQRKGLPEKGDWGELVDSLDIMRCLTLIDVHWMSIFKRKLSIDHRNWTKELIGVRHKCAHIGGQDFDTDFTWRALDTMARLCEQIDAESTEEIRALIRKIRYGTPEASIFANGVASVQTTSAKLDKSGVLASPPLSGLPSWRYVIEPHPDVAQGRYRNAEFAADLAQVARGEGAIEYKDPVEFFARTYITEGMTGLLVQALRRVAGKDGEPVIQLKTAFGGGKTHSMLALYHLLRGQASIDKMPNVKPVLERAGLSSIVKTNVAVLVGTALDPSKSKRPPKYPGITINTLWGEMAVQLAEQAGNLSLYDFVKEADKRGVSPGSEVLTKLFDACGPCLILIDELVAYAKKLYGVAGLPAGSFDNLISFIQELTEAARASKNSLVVASIPESDIEIGGEAGKIALETIEHTFGRMEAIWKPVGANEGFEIVRRRLFLPPQDPASLEQVCRAFSEMYNQSSSDFPLECKELEYYERLKACYPIHPEVFDRLYGDWATLERFQKTRGVLRLMAAVIHDLWMKNDGGLLIMPSSIALDNPNVREELTRHLSEGWNAIIDKEIDGRNSIPYVIEEKNPRFSRCLAARRVARTIMLGSAPSVKEQRNRGIEVSRIRLGVVQPGEQVSVFNDALSHLQNQLTYLYSDMSNNRFWYDTRPTLRKTVEDRAVQIPISEVEWEIERRLKSMRERGEFAGVHACPSSSLDIPDEQTVRLVVLAPGFTHKQGSHNSKAIQEAGNILNYRGASPRIYRNMLAFVAPDSEIILSLTSEVRKYLAWKSIIDDVESLNLDIVQQREAKRSLNTSDETVELRLKETYCWLLVPVQDGSNPIEWEKTRISGGTETHIIKASKKMVQMEQLITRWSPALLRMELDRWLWKDQQHIEIKKLWEYLSSYCYLPRLKNVDVLLDAIKNGISSDEYFAYAEGITGEGRYLALRFNQSSGSYIDIHGYLVRPEVAKAQIEKERLEREKEKNPDGIIYPGGSAPAQNPGVQDPGTGWETTVITSSGATTPQVLQDKKPRRFYGTVKLDTSRIGRDAGRIAEEIVQHLNLLPGASVEVTLEIHAEIADGVPDNVVRTVTENCRTLKFTNFAFEEE